MSQHLVRSTPRGQRANARLLSPFLCSRSGSYGIPPSCVAAAELQTQPTPPLAANADEGIDLLRRHHTGHALPRTHIDALPHHEGHVEGTRPAEDDH